MRKKLRGSCFPSYRRSALGAAVAMAMMASPAQVMAFEFKSGEVAGSLDTTVSLGALWRMEGREGSLVSIANGGTSRDPNSDDGNLKYDRNDLVATTLKATHDLELKYRNFGVFVQDRKSVV